MPSTSKKQQRFFGMIHGANKSGKKLKGKAGKVQRQMSKSQVKHYTKLATDLALLGIKRFKFDVDNFFMP